MKIIEHIELALDLKILINALGGARRAARFEADAIWSLSAIKRYARPQVLVDFFDLQKHSHTQVALKQPHGGDDLILNVGARAKLLDHARMVQVSLGTLGTEIDQRRDQLKKEKKELRAFILDTAAVLTLAELGQHINQLAEIEAASRQWGVGRRMAPGSLEGWTMDDQKHLAKLLPMEKIGVGMNSAGMLIPLKSATALIGMGPGYSSSKVGNVCQWCRHQHTCLARYLPSHSPGEG